MFYSTIRWLFLALAAPMFRLRIEGRENLPKSGPAILVAPHRSWLDPPAVGGACPRKITFLMIDRIYKKRGQGWFYRGMDALPVSREGRLTTAALRGALRRLKNGGLIGIFPEGRVVHPGDRFEVHPGAAMLASRSGAPLIPVALEGTARAWPHGRRFPRPRRVTVRFHPPLQAGATSRDERLVELNAAIERFLAGFGHEKP